MESWALAGVLVLGIGFTVFLVVRHNWLRTRDDDLRVSGIPTSGRVLRLRHDDASAEDDLFILSIDVTVPAGTTYRTAEATIAIELRAFIAAHVLGSIQPGCTIRLRVDPRNVERAVLDLPAMNLA